jgi:hypothetical protein
MLRLPLFRDISVRTPKYTFSYPSGLLFGTQFPQICLGVTEKVAFEDTSRLRTRAIKASCGKITLFFGQIFCPSHPSPMFFPYHLFVSMSFTGVSQCSVPSNVTPRTARCVLLSIRAVYPTHTLMLHFAGLLKHRCPQDILNRFMTSSHFTALSINRANQTLYPYTDDSFPWFLPQHTAPFPNLTHDAPFAHCMSIPVNTWQVLNSSVRLARDVIHYALLV